MWEAPGSAAAQIQASSLLPHTGGCDLGSLSSLQEGAPFSVPSAGLQAGGRWTLDVGVSPPPEFSQALSAGGTRCCPFFPLPLQFHGQGNQPVGMAEGSLPNHRSLEVFKDRVGECWAGLQRSLEGDAKKAEYSGKSETGVSDPFRSKRIWLSVALGHINAHMQRGCLRIKPPIKQGIIRGP